MGLIRSEGIAEFRAHLDTYSARDLSLCTANTMSSDETLSIKNEYVKAPRSNLIKIFYFDSIGAACGRGQKNRVSNYDVERITSEEDTLFPVTVQTKRALMS